MSSLKTRTLDVTKRLSSDSLYRNSSVLLVNLGITSITGSLFWSICARLYPPSEVGHATALLAALNLALALSTIGMHRTIIRFFHGAESRQHLLSSSLAIVLGASAVLT
jgi:O-antigen/teichoic acid export membrane protein